MEKGFLQKHGFRTLAISYKKEIDGQLVKFDTTTRLWYMNEQIRSFEEVKALLEKFKK